MGKRRAIRAMFLLGVIYLTTTTVTLAQDSFVDNLDCKGEFDGEMLAADELRSILIAHADLHDSGHKDKWNDKPFDMCGVIVHRAALSQMNLSGAHLLRANLSDADLSGADMRYADLRGANLRDADLRGTNLAHAKLDEADLTEADLTKADLRETVLVQAKLNGARLARAIFEPASLPDPAGFLGVRGLSEIQFSGQVNPAVELRNIFRESGFRSQEKAITAALTKHGLNAPALFRERLFQGYIAGGHITDYGANPWGALGWLSALVFLFLWPYLLALRAHQQMNGIWLIRSEDRVLTGQSEPDQELVPYSGLIRSIPWALYFSVLSAFHFGWRELNLGNWIIRLQSREYTLRATGWVRTVSGLQSLSSLYLVALFLISYFGDPFA